MPARESARALRFDLTTLKLFLAVVEAKSIAAAAKREHLTGPAISRRISEIEERIGVKLLERHRSGIRPTAAGNLLAAEAQRVVDGLARLHARLGEYSEGCLGEVRLASTATGLAGRLPTDLKRFARVHPAVTFQMKESRSSATVNAVRDGEVELGIFVENPAVSRDGLDTYAYERGSLVLVAPRRHALSGRKRVSLETAARYEFIGVSRDTTLGALLARAMRDTGVALRSRIEVSGHEPVRRLVQAGMGLGVLPGWAAPYAKAMNLQCIPFADPQLRYTVLIAARSRGTLAPSAHRLLAYLLEQSALHHRARAPAARG